MIHSAPESAGSALADRSERSDPIAIFAPFGMDGLLIADVLRSAAPAECLTDIESFCDRLADGAVGVLTTEALSPDRLERLCETVHKQPAWSDTPLILLTNRIDPASYAYLAESLGNVVIIQRPLDPPSLLTVVKTALRARQKQVQVRDLLLAGETQNARIEALNEHLLLAVSAAEMGTWEYNAASGLRHESAGAGPLFGHSAEPVDITLDTWADRIIPQDRARVVAEFEAALCGDAEFKTEYRIQVSGESGPRWIASKAVVFRDAAGAVVRVIGVIADITERKNVEAELRQRQREIEALNERLKRAMTETHHRVKNSLQLISAFVEIQAGEHPDTVPISELLRINSQVRTLAAVHDVLTDQTKHGEPDGLVSAKRLLEKLLPMLQRMTGAKRLLYEISDVRLPSRQGTSLALIANELILNALKHSGSEVEVSLTTSGRTVMLSVADDGPGLPEGFDVEQSSNTGLALVENLVRWDLHGEAFYGNRENGHGAHLKVTFPSSFDREITR